MDARLSFRRRAVLLSEVRRNDELPRGGIPPVIASHLEGGSAWGSPPGTIPFLGQRIRSRSVNRVLCGRARFASGLLCLGGLQGEATG